MRNASVAAKARAMYSLHLKDFDYHQLAEQKRVEDIAMFLEKHPRYEEVMEGIRNVEIHRDILEQRIRVMVPMEYKSLMRFGQAARAKAFFSLDLERDLIVDMLYALKHGERYQPSREMVELSQSISFNVAQLVNCTSIEAMLAIVSPSPYYKVLDVELSNNTPLWMIEIKLYDIYVRTVLERDVKNNETFKNLFTFDVELRRVQEAFRMMKYANIEYITLLNESKWIPYKVKKQEMIGWMSTSDQDAFLASAKQKYAMPQDTYRHTFERQCDRLRLKIAMRTLRNSQDSQTVVYAYKMLMDIEVRNIVTIIEGVRYRKNVPSIVDQLVFEVKHGN